MKGQGPRRLPNARQRRNSPRDSLTRLLIWLIDGLMKADPSSRVQRNSNKGDQEWARVSVDSQTYH